nr:recombinase family protein [Saccharopolyspora sp. ASAGF58]
MIDREGARIGEELSDGLSAWKKDVRRPGWEKLLERVKQGLSDGIVVWHTDRLFRQALRPWAGEVVPRRTPS